MTSINQTAWRITDVPIYYRKSILLENPKLVTYMYHDGMFVLDVSKELVKRDYKNIYHCHLEHFAELFKLIPDDKAIELVIGSPRFAKYMDCNTEEKTNALKKIVSDHYANIIHCPEKNVSELLPLVPAHKFANPQNFDGLVLSGYNFNKYFASKSKFYKVTRHDEVHYDLELKDGMNIDDKPFLKDCDCKGGIYFSDKPNKWAYLYDCSVNKCNLREVIIPNDAIVRIEGDKMKADKIILLHKITDYFDRNFDYKNAESVVTN
jgi:hypothetical protein